MTPTKRNCAIRKPREQLLAREPFPFDDGAASIFHVHLKHVLGKVDANRGTVHDDSSFVLNAGGLILQLDTPDAVRKGGVHTIIPDPDTLGDWLRRMGDPQTGQAGLVGLGQVA